MLVLVHVLIHECRQPKMKRAHGVSSLLKSVSARNCFVNYHVDAIFQILVIVNLFHIMHSNLQVGQYLWACRHIERQHHPFITLQTESWWEVYLGTVLSVHTPVHISRKRNSSWTDKPMLMKLYVVGSIWPQIVYEERSSWFEKYQGT